MTTKYENLTIKYNTFYKSCMLIDNKRYVCYCGDINRNIHKFKTMNTIMEYFSNNNVSIEILILNKKEFDITFRTKSNDLSVKETLRYSVKKHDNINYARSIADKLCNNVMPYFSLVFMIPSSTLKELYYKNYDTIIDIITKYFVGSMSHFMILNSFMNKWSNLTIFSNNYGYYLTMFKSEFNCVIDYEIKEPSKKNIFKRTVNKDIFKKYIIERSLVENKLTYVELKRTVFILRKICNSNTLSSIENRYEFAEQLITLAKSYPECVLIFDRDLWKRFILDTIDIYIENDNLDTSVLSEILYLAYINNQISKYEFSPRLFRFNVYYATRYVMSNKHINIDKFLNSMKYLLIYSSLDKRNVMSLLIKSEYIETLISILTNVNDMCLPCEYIYEVMRYDILNIDNVISTIRDMGFVLV